MNPTEITTGQRIEKEITKQDYKMITRSLSQSHLFANLNEKSREQIIRRMKLVKIHTGDTIYQAGVQSQNFYIV
jgi:hypothetical protein